MEFCLAVGLRSGGGGAKSELGVFRRLSTFLIYLPILFPSAYSWRKGTVSIQGHFTFATNSTRKWHTRHYKTTYSQSKWLTKRANRQSPKNRPKNSTYLHSKGVPLLVIRGCPNQPHLFFAARTISGIRFGGMDVLRWGHRILWIVSMYAHPRLSCALISHRLYMPDHLPTKVSEGVCQNSRNFDVFLPGVSPPFSGLPSGGSEVL